MADYWLRRRFELFQVMAMAGDSYAQSMLGYYYAAGVYVEKDEIEAYAFYNLALVGMDSARMDLDSLEGRLSAGQIMEGQKRTKELQKKIEANVNAKK